MSYSTVVGASLFCSESEGGRRVNSITFAYLYQTVQSASVRFQEHKSEHFRAYNFANTNLNWELHRQKISWLNTQHKQFSQ